MPVDEPTQDTTILPSPSMGEGQGSVAQAPSPAGGDGATADDPRIAQLTADLQTSATQLAQLTGALEQEQQTTAALKAALSSAASAYRTAALATLPEVPPELVGGETVEDVQASIQRAKDLVEAVKARLPAATGAPAPSPVVAAPPVQVPAGAPARTGPDTTAMTAAEKIRYALSTP